uniref:Endonuclease/exonuclease/phosphatase domain-containing protein n=1 Tax=viral metagenome TaxID=1070528 RepID=A0A6C0LSE9_9ZZZZ
MDELTQKILEQRFKIIWTDSGDYIEAKENINIDNFKDQKLKDKFKSYFLNNDPLYYTFNYQPLIDVAITKANPMNLFQNRGTEKKIGGHVILSIEKNQYFFKGMKVFYRANILKESSGLKWFGEETIAFKYAKRYHGGINVYEPIRPIKLLVYSNIENIKKIIKYYEKHNPAIVHSIKIKTGVGISIIKQVEFYAKYNKFDSIWLTRYPIVSPISNQITKIIPGMNLWGRGKIDRDVGEAICNYCCKHNFDGYISYETFSPFMLIVSEEIVLCNYYDVMKRKVDHPLDWLMWEKYLPIKIENNFLMAENFSNRNNDFQIIRFWNNNMMNTESNKRIRKILNKLKKSSSLIIVTLNVHSFYSINYLYTSIDTFHKFLLFLRNFKIDLIGLQEFQIHPELTLTYIETKLSELGYNLIFIPTVSNEFGNAIISKYSMNILNTIILPNEPRFKTVRKLTSFTINHPKYGFIIFGITHLEIGDRYTSRQGSILSEYEVKEIMISNSIVRRNQIDTIIKESPKPDIIFGDFNSNPDDLEFDKMLEKYNTYLDKNTTPFHTIVDYIFYRKTSNLKPIFKAVINYRYSDHLPVLNVLE